MGDYYWYGWQGDRNTTAAAEMYANAAYKGDPHVSCRSNLSTSQFSDIPVGM